MTLLIIISHLLCRHVHNETFFDKVPSSATCPSSPQGDQHRIYSENSHNGGDVFEDESGIYRDDELGDMFDDTHADVARSNANDEEECRDENVPCNQSDRISIHQTAESTNMLHRNPYDSLKATEESGPSNNTTRTRTHQTAESTNMFHRNQYDSMKATEESGPSNSTIHNSTHQNAGSIDMFQRGQYDSMKSNGEDSQSSGQLENDSNMLTQTYSDDTAIDKKEETVEIGITNSRKSINEDVTSNGNNSVKLTSTNKRLVRKRIEATGMKNKKTNPKRMSAAALKKQKDDRFFKDINVDDDSDV